MKLRPSRSPAAAPVLALALIGAIAAWAGGAGCGGDDDGEAAPDAGAGGEDRCAIASGDGVSFDPADEPCRLLSSYRLFTDAVAQAPAAGVVPYDLNTALFSDYADKYRFVWLPEGTAMTYAAADSFGFPVGAVIGKTFAYLDDLRDPEGGRRLLETRLLVHAADGWKGLTYVWDEAQTEAVLAVAGAALDVSWLDRDGAPRELTYLVPNQNQCKECHEEREGVMGPLGPKARHLNRDFGYGGDPVNQLAHFTDLGYLTGAPADPDEAPRAPVFDDPDSGSVDARARAWLEINCAHCHNPEGRARTSGLDLLASQTRPFEFGVCKPPVAAGPGSGGLQYNIVPGDPDASILVFRIESTVPSIQMPELLRQLVHTEGLALVRDWIGTMPPDPCGQTP